MKEWAGLQKTALPKFLRFARRDSGCALTIAETSLLLARSGPIHM
jgi:hypothetical protein